MPKMFKMYGEMFMEVTPQPWMMRSKTIKGRIEDGRVFCVNVNSGALTCYDPKNYLVEAPRKAPAIVMPKPVDPVFFLKFPGADPIRIPVNYKAANKFIQSMANRRSMIGCLVYSDQKVLPVGFPINRSLADSIENVRQMYIQSYNLVGA